MSNDKSLALVPRTIQEAESMAVAFAKSQLVPDAFKNRPQDAFLAIAYGLEIGIPPVSALRAVAVIKGKCTLYADAMVGLVLASGKAKYFSCVESDGTKATYETHRHGAPEPVRKSFSLEDAKTAGLLSNGTYKSYPRQMLEARAKAHLARDQYPDLLHGIYSAEEVSEFDDAPARPAATVSQFRAPAVVDAEIISETDPATAIAERLVACTTQVELDALVSEIKALPEGKSKAELRTVYTAQKKLIAQAAERAAAETPFDADEAAAS